MSYKWLILILLSSILTCCSLFSDNKAIYEGFYAAGFEINSFEPCNTNERWWIVPGNKKAVDQLLEGYFTIIEQQPVRVYVRLLGRPSKKGKYGHLGEYEREFELDAVLELRPAQEKDCAGK
ncbi:MAG: hypothetical protein D6813_05540 [Calditrichaeota bacterium]|nr:MAG: hypothetical protein D6813_05540 [Calditrichota bacterium]